MTRDKRYRCSALEKLFAGCVTDNPANEIMEIAQRALNDGVIDAKRYAVVHYRFPFSGFEPESLEEVGKRLDVNSQRARVLEHDAGRKLISYLPNPEKVSYSNFYI